MANLPTLALGTFLNVADAQIQGSDPVLEVIASADDADYVFTSNNLTHQAIAAFVLDDMPADFGTMTSLAVRLRYLQSGLSNNTWDSVQSAVIAAVGDTLFTNIATVASNITTTTPVTSSVIALTDPGNWGTLTKADWDSALVRVLFNITRNKGGDTYQARVVAAELTGTYDIAVAPTGNPVPQMLMQRRRR